jgi:hypothetical protein
LCANVADRDSDAVGTGDARPNSLNRNHVKRRPLLQHRSLFPSRG